MAKKKTNKKEIVTVLLIILMSMRKWMTVFCTLLFLLGMTACAPAKEEVQYSENILVSFNHGAPGYGTREECVDAEIFIYTDRTVKVVVYYPQEMEIASFTITEEDYEALEKVAVAEEISKLHVEEEQGACDGSSYYISLYDSNDKSIVTKGGYMPQGGEFGEIYRGIKEVLEPYNISSYVVEYRECLAKDIPYQKNVTEAMENEKIETEVKEAETKEAEGKEADVNEPEMKASETTKILETEEETLGNPRSSYGLGSASYLRGRNVLVSLFVTTPESGFTKEEQEEALAKVEKAVTYIEAQAAAYGVETEFIYDFSEYQDLKLEAEADFVINEDVDFIDRLDEEIARWKQEKISYDEVLQKYEADGIAMLIFVNNPGISYAIVYDGTDSDKETVILFTEDYYKPGCEETATAYAHEILHVFGAHDLYEDAEFTKEVSDYIALTYPDEIMYTVNESGGEITAQLSGVTAYHLGWIDEVGELEQFPQLARE